jgi:hypothetical protein
MAYSEQTVSFSSSSERCGTSFCVPGYRACTRFTLSLPEKEAQAKDEVLRGIREPRVAAPS